MTETVVLDDLAAARRITLARPAKANALDAAMMASVASAVRKAPAAGATAVVLTASGGNFCAGADIEEFVAGDEGLHAQEAALLDLIGALSGSAIPVLAIARGRALGAGAILLALADVVIAADDLAVGAPEIRFDMYPVVVHAVLGQRLGAGAARQLCVSGRLLAAGEARAAGLVTDIAAIATFEHDAAQRLDFYLRRTAALSIARRAWQS